MRMAFEGARSGYQHVIDTFWADAAEQGVSLRTTTPVSKAAFCNARKGLKPKLFRELLERVNACTDAALSVDDSGCGWQGRRLFAVDGTDNDRSP